MVCWHSNSAQSRRCIFFVCVYDSWHRPRILPGIICHVRTRYRTWYYRFWRSSRACCWYAKRTQLALRNVPKQLHAARYSNERWAIFVPLQLSIYGQLFYLGRQAFYVFDGQSAPQRLSDKVEPWILGNVNATAPSYAMQGDRTQYWMFYYNNRIHIVYDSTGSGLLGTWLVFDLINSGWTIQQPADAVIAYAALDGPGDPAPTVGVIFCQSSGNQYFWDQYSTGVMTADQYNGTTGANIQAGFSTKFFKVGTPGTPKRIMRWYPEFFAGNLNATCTITNDYGASSVASAVNALSNNSYYNNTASQTINGGVGYGYALWSSGTRTFVGAPTTRIDTNLQGEAFSFGASTNAQTQPWIFQGMTGNYAQEARV